MNAKQLVVGIDKIVHWRQRRLYNNHVSHKMMYSLSIVVHVSHDLDLVRTWYVGWLWMIMRGSMLGNNDTTTWMRWRIMMTWSSYIGLRLVVISTWLSCDSSFIVRDDQQTADPVFWNNTRLDGRWDGWDYSSAILLVSKGGESNRSLGAWLGTSVTTLFMSGIVHFGHGLYMLVTTLPCRGVCVQIRRKRLGWEPLSRP